MKQKSSKQKLKDGFIELIYKNNPRYFLTITFPWLTYPKKAEEMQKLFLKGINQKAYRTRNKHAKNGYMNGMSIREHTHKLYTDHFHIVVFDDQYLPDEKRFNEIIEQQLKRMDGQFGRDKITSVDLQRYYETGKYSLEEYVFKQFNWWKPEQDCVDDAGCLEFDNVLFGKVNSFV